MRWTPGTSDKNIEDRRGQSFGGGLRGGMPLGIVGILVLVVLSLLTGQNFLGLLDSGGGGAVIPADSPAGQAGPVQSSPQEQQLVEFVTFVFNDNQETWARIVPGRYREAKLVLFRDAVQSACGIGEAATGPFYCPGDEKVYIDLGFYDELKRRFGAPGDFAQAYVLAHEVGHHVQSVLGIERQVRQLQQSRPDAANQLSVRMELQADCFAGVWGHSTNRKGLLEQGDVEEGMNAAASIGDDRIQSQVAGRVRPESFTHGSSAQRVEWFRRGLETGNADSCDTFGRGTD
jgi:uncharacterized protein